MDSLFEYHVIQNTALTAFAIAQATIRACEETSSKKGLDLFAAFLIPPLIYHKRTADTLATKQMTDGLFFRVIADDREIVVGLQERLMSMTYDTMRAIHLGCSAGAFRLVRDDRVELFPVIKAVPGNIGRAAAVDPVGVVLAAAKRLGYCFATTDLGIICAVLRVRF